MKRDVDLFSLYMARQNKEESRALPARAYRDPAETVEFESEIRRREQERKARAMKNGRNSE